VGRLRRLRRGRSAGESPGSRPRASAVTKAARRIARYPEAKDMLLQGEPNLIGTTAKIQETAVTRMAGRGIRCAASLPWKRNPGMFDWKLWTRLPMPKFKPKSMKVVSAEIAFVRYASTVCMIGTGFRLREMLVDIRNMVIFR